MVKLSDRHIKFLLQTSLNGFIGITNRKIALHNKNSNPASAPTVDQITGTFANDFTSFSIEATTLVPYVPAHYEDNDKELTIERTVGFFASNDWKKSLPELLSSAYQLDATTMPTIQSVTVEEDQLNRRITISHSIVFKAISYTNVKRIVNAYHAADVKHPDYFSTILVRGSKPSTLAVNNELTISGTELQAKCFISKVGQTTNANMPLMSMLFNYRFLDFTNFSKAHASSLIHTPVLQKEELKLNLNFHTVIEAELEANGKTKFISVNINQPIIGADNRFFWQDVDMIDLLSVRATKAEIKKFLKGYAVEGTKVNWIKTNGLKLNNVAVSNHAKYSKITFIGSLLGSDLIIEVSKRGAVKITDLSGEDLAMYDHNKAEKLTRMIQAELSDLFTNDRVYAANLFYSIVPTWDSMDTTLLFS